MWCGPDESGVGLRLVPLGARGARRCAHAQGRGAPRSNVRTARAGSASVGMRRASPTVGRSRPCPGANPAPDRWADPGRRRGISPIPGRRPGAPIGAPTRHFANRGRNAAFPVKFRPERRYGRVRPQERSPWPGDGHSHARAGSRGGPVRSFRTRIRPYGRWGRRLSRSGAAGSHSAAGKSLGRGEVTRPRGSHSAAETPRPAWTAPSARTQRPGPGHDARYVGRLASGATAIGVIPVPRRIGETA